MMRKTAYFSIQKDITESPVTMGGKDVALYCYPLPVLPMTLENVHMWRMFVGALVQHVPIVSVFVHMCA